MHSLSLLSLSRNYLSFFLNYLSYFSLLSRAPREAVARAGKRHWLNLPLAYRHDCRLSSMWRRWKWSTRSHTANLWTLSWHRYVYTMNTVLFHFIITLSSLIPSLISYFTLSSISLSYFSCSVSHLLFSLIRNWFVSTPYLTWWRKALWRCRRQSRVRLPPSSSIVTASLLLKPPTLLFYFHISTLTTSALIASSRLL